MTVRRWALVAVVGQSVFPIAWLVAGGIDANYSHERNYVSELAARDAAHPWIVAIGIVALGISFIALGLALGRALPASRWSRLTAALFVAGGAGIVLAGVLPVDCSASSDRVCEMREMEWDLSWRHYAHGFIAFAAQFLFAFTPFALALALRRGPLARVALGFGVAGLLFGVGQFLAVTFDEDRAGIYQRAGLIVLQGWAYLLAASLLLASFVRPRGFAEPVKGDPHS